ncbi:MULTISPECIES: hypothetical protein [Polynucleobacter]|nr:MULTISPECIES: hypothetical protein [Polynucleobacter]MBU3552524.1 hypothetical protein [Polynucleobacter sp. MWH-Post4-6-1]
MTLKIMNKSLRIATNLLFALSLLYGNAYAADPTLEPSATFTLDIKALTMFSGESAVPLSKGVLTFQGKQYPFTVLAVTMGNRFGEAELKATGYVYGMKDISQFEGSYFQIGGGIKPDDALETVTVKNEKGVIAMVSGKLTAPMWFPSTGAVVKLTK